jgi:hypothetical protein
MLWSIRSKGKLVPALSILLASLPWLGRRRTKQGNPRTARQIEAAHRTALAKGEVGISERKPIPTLGDFIDNRFSTRSGIHF